MKLRARLALLATAALPMIAACGSSDNNSGGTPTSAATSSSSGGTTAGTTADTSSASTASTAAPSSGGDVTLQFWTWSPPEATLNEVIAGFEKENPGIKVKLNFYESTAYQDRLPLALSSGDPIDIAAVQTSTMVNTVKADLEELPPLFDQYASKPLAEMLKPKAIEQAKVLADDGKVYIAPLGALGSVVAYYNTDLLDELGLDVPRTRADLANLVKVTTEKRPDLLPVSFTGANWMLDEITNTITEQSSPGFFNSVRYNKGGKWDSPEYQASYSAMVGLFNDGIFSKDTLDLDYGRGNELFTTGKAVALLQGTWEGGLLSPKYRADNSIALQHVTAAALPVMIDGGKPTIRSFIEVGLAVPKNSEHKAEAVKFIEYMTSGGGVDPWASTLFEVPSAIGYTLPSSVFTGDTRAADGYAELVDLINNPGSDRNNVSDFSVVAGDAIIDSILNGTSATDATAKLQSEWDSGKYSNSQ